MSKPPRCQGTAARVKAMAVRLPCTGGLCLEEAGSSSQAGGGICAVPGGLRECRLWKDRVGGKARSRGAAVGSVSKLQEAGSTSKAVWPELWRVGEEGE